ncbi:MAG: carboxypeptidase-like regulatory domain-containing protein [Chitinophagales bacterium]|nr:carboxypeptidase-like regulatory domain-containing protein [Chitinophagaceae bacterium]MCB9065440.1 carboxypeptidase-like regulatory domain-containing protein [Chitinophagales bacterium]
MKLLVFILCLIPIVGFGQTLTGNVRDNQTGMPLYPVSVINIKTQAISYSNERGYFTIRAEAGEQIAFSFIGYKSKQITMPISVGTYNTEVKLEAVSYRLQEIILTPDYTPYQRDSITRRQTYKTTLGTQHASPFNSPFSFVAEKVSRKSKRTFRFQKNFYTWEQQKFINTRYTPQLVEEMTGAEGDTIGYFMSANPMPYDYARAATELELKMWIRYHYRQWLKHVDTAGLPLLDSTIIKEMD